MLSQITKNQDQTKMKLTLALSLTSLLGIGLVLAIINGPLSAAVIIIALVTILIFILKTEWGVYLIILSLVSGQLVRIPLTGTSAIQPTDILVVILVSIWLIKKIILNQKIKSTFIGPFLCVFLSIAFISLINGLRFLDTDQAIISFFYLIRIASYMTLFFIGADIFSQQKKIYTLEKILLSAFFVIAAIGIVQVIVFPSLAKWAALYGWDPHMGRLFSTFLDPNFAGAFLVMGFIISLAFLFYAKSFEGRVALISASLLMLVAVILTYSRSTYLFLFISFFVLSILRSKKFLLVGIVAIIILMLIFPKSLDRIQGGFSIDESARTRFKTWENTLTIIKDHPMLGVGFNSFRYAQESYTFSKETTGGHAGAGSDSSLLFIFATTGFFGLLSYLIFYFLALIKTKKTFNYSLSAQQKGIGLALFSIMVGFLFHSVFVNSLFYPAIMAPFFLMLGLISAENKVSKITKH
ncbi:O-antigen ligase family protein [Patescibacteria group bacterium]|nr:O-antigen ligase family protein [Patescibacteria group bacterium]